MASFDEHIAAMFSDEQAEGFARRFRVEIEWSYEPSQDGAPQPEKTHRAYFSSFAKDTMVRSGAADAVAAELCRQYPRGVPASAIVAADRFTNYTLTKEEGADERPKELLTGSYLRVFVQVKFGDDWYTMMNVRPHAFKAERRDGRGYRIKVDAPNDPTCRLFLDVDSTRTRMLIKRWTLVITPSSVVRAVTAGG